MLTTENARGPHGLSLADLDNASEWERAAQVLDLEAGMMTRLRNPQIECMSRHSYSGGETAGAATLYIAAGMESGRETIAELTVGNCGSAAVVAQQALEVQMQAALAGVDARGAAVGLQLQHAAMTEHELWHFARECAPLIARVLGDTHLLPTDVASAACARWMSPAAAQFSGRVTAPSLPSSEFVAWQDALLAHVVVAMGALALEEMGRRFPGATAAVVGTGAVARGCLRSFHEEGFQIVAIADESGALVDNGGMDISAVLKHGDSGGLLVEYGDAEHALRSAAIAMPTDILLLDTPGDEITKENAAAVRAAVVIEAASGCLTPGAAEILSERGVLVVPTRMIQCMRVTPEMLLGNRSSRSQQDMQRLARHHARRLWEEVSAVRKQRQVPLPTAELLLTLERLAEKERGTRP